MTGDIDDYLAGDGVVLHVFADASEAERSFLAWFDEEVLGLDSAEYRQAFWREAYRTGRTAGHVPRTWGDFVRRHGFARSAEPGFILAIGLLACLTYGFWLVRKAVEARLARTRRRLYYEAERTRRRALAADRRAIKIRRTANAKPSLCEIRAAYARAHDSPLAALRLGALLEDLECYVDNHAFADAAGRVRGRAGGIKRLLEAEAPDLFRHYKHVMSYKARAKRYRQACGSPAAGEPAPPQAPSAWRPFRFPARPELASVGALTAWMASHGNTAYLRARATPESDFAKTSKA